MSAPVPRNLLTLQLVDFMVTQLEPDGVGSQAGAIQSVHPDEKFRQAAERMSQRKRRDRPRKIRRDTAFPRTSFFSGSSIPRGV